MTFEMLRHCCCAKKGVTEDYPFDSTTATFRVMGKIFAIADSEEFTRVNLKCEPERALNLREQYAGVIPGYHMNKKHWNTILLDGSLPQDDIFQWIEESYHLVTAKLPKNLKEELEAL